MTDLSLHDNVHKSRIAVWVTLFDNVFSLGPFFLTHDFIFNVSVFTDTIGRFVIYFISIVSHCYAGNYDALELLRNAIARSGFGASRLAALLGPQPGARS